MKRIIAIDDDESNRKVVLDFLTGQGFGVIPAKDGRDGLQKIKAEKPDLILTEIRLSEMDGFQLIKAVRETPGVKNTPVIILSAYAMPGDSDKGYSAGCDAYLTKPFNFQELLGTINKLIKQ